MNICKNICLFFPLPFLLKQAHVRTLAETASAAALSTACFVSFFLISFSLCWMLVAFGCTLAMLFVHSQFFLCEFLV